MNLRTLLEIYFAFNLSFSGFYLASQLDWARTPYEKFKVFIYYLGFLIFGCLYYFFLFIIGVFTMLWDCSNIQFQSGFWLAFLFTRKYYNLPIDRLEKINLSAYKKIDSKKIKDRIFVYSVKKINSRNNFTYEYVEPSF